MVCSLLPNSISAGYTIIIGPFAHPLLYELLKIGRAQILLHEVHGMDDFNVEITEFYPEDLSSLKDTHVSVSYRYQHGDTKKTYHQFEVGTIVSVPEKRSRKVRC